MFEDLWHKFRYSILGEKIRSLIPDPIVNLFEHLPLAILATIFYRYPARKLIVIGVTGTDGKTLQNLFKRDLHHGTHNYRLCRVPQKS